jgi:hypothetical protein
MKAQFDSTNSEQKLAYEMIAKTSNSFFLTGRAGTGKTTFLKMVQEEVKKNFVVLAPTGVAAVNAGGKTIHSFFGLPLGVLCPWDTGVLNGDKISLVRHIDTIIVDEVSMVRCDVIDAMDRTLRQARRSSAPFGGVQMVFVGDVFQLEPVVTREDRAILMEYYGAGPYYFYKAAAIERLGLPKIEFRKIYRQSDPAFIEILEHIRTGRATTRDLIRINSRVRLPGEGSTKIHIVLTSTRKEAQLLNADRLEALEGDPMVYEAEYEGQMNRQSPGSDVAEDRLVLKVGAQVMFTRNSSFGLWVNGTLGVVESLSDDGVCVRLEDGTVHDVQKAQWENIEYEFDKESKTCKKKVVGSVTQYPLRLAWAITIHKSQSLTFDRVAVDFGQSAFCNGQAYVALSRARSLEGLELLRPMGPSSVLVSRDVINFSSDINDEERIRRELEIGAALDAYVRTNDYDAAASKLFDMASEAAERGDVALSHDLMTRALAMVVDDTCLQGREWVTVPYDGYRSRVLNAAGLYYSGHKGEAEDILEGMRTAISGDVDALYILSRCKEDREDWQGVEPLYYAMISLWDALRDKGLDAETFRKVRYRTAILNERVYHDPGAGLMRQLMAENPAYAPFHAALRWMLAANEEAVKEAAEEEDNPLVEMVFSDKTTEEEFLARVDAARKDRSAEWQAYRRFVNNLKLAMPC